MYPSHVETCQGQSFTQRMSFNRVQPAETHVSLTNIIMRLFERVVYKQEIASAFKSVVEQNQFAYKGITSTSDALIMCLHHWLLKVVK